MINGVGFVIAKLLLINYEQLELSNLGSLLFFPNIVLALTMMGICTHLFKNYQQNQTKRIQQHNESQSKLLSILSHDLRAPINNLEILTSEFEKGRMDADRLSVIMPMISDSLKNTSLLIDNTIHWLNREIHSLKIKSQSIELRKVISKNISLYEPIAARKKLKLQFHETTDHHVNSDPDVVDMILRNILSNAIKFSPENGEPIELFTEMDGDSAWIGVKDQGIGLEPHELSVLLESERQTRKGTLNEEGTGMGLILIHYFIHKINSQLRVDSTKGKGTSIAFRLPLDVENATNQT